MTVGGIGEKFGVIGHVAGIEVTQEIITNHLISWGIKRIAHGLNVGLAKENARTLGHDLAVERNGSTFELGIMIRHHLGDRRTNFFQRITAAQRVLHIINPESAVLIRGTITDEHDLAKTSECGLMRIKPFACCVDIFAVDCNVQTFVIPGEGPLLPSSFTSDPQVLDACPGGNFFRVVLHTHCIGTRTVEIGRVNCTDE